MSFVHDLMNDLYDYGFSDMEYIVDSEFERITICENGEPKAHIREVCFDDNHEFEVWFNGEEHSAYKGIFYKIEDAFLYVTCDSGYETHYLKIPLFCNYDGNDTVSIETT